MTEQSRRVVANLALSLDGHYAAPDDPVDMSWVVPYATTDAARDLVTRLRTDATTVVLGRVNAEGFLGFWPTLIGAEGIDPRDEGFAQYLLDVDKVVLSSSLSEAPWDHTTLADRPATDVVDELQATDGGDIWVMSSSSVIKPLLAADRVDRLALTVAPAFLGGGPRLFDDGLPTSRWTIAHREADDNGALCVVYDRVR